MGRKTWESLPQRPLKDRINCVLTKDAKFKDAPISVSSIHDGLRNLKQAGCSTVYITGGSNVYNTCHEEGISEYIIWTRVCGNGIKCDTDVNLALVDTKYEPLAISRTQGSGAYTFDLVFLRKKGFIPSVQQLEYEAKIVNHIKTLSFIDDSGRTTSFTRCSGSTNLQPSIKYKGHEEYQYLDIMNDIIKTGVFMDDRTGVGTFSKFGALMRYDLQNSFPLLTTKRVYWKGVVEELLWFLKGETDALKLSAKNVHIWDGNGSKEFLRTRGLAHRREGDLGPVYGFQWRHFGAKYRTCDDDYTSEGVDQIAQLVENIRKDPTSRRHIVSAWNPAALNDMALPPCHVLSQFVVDPNKGELSCCLYQRSGDWGLGIPFNIASYSLLCLIIAHLTGLKPKEFVHYVANAHVYKNHVEPLEEQLQRVPRPFPRVKISASVKNIDDIKFEDIKLIGYEPYPTIKMEMAV